MTEGNALQETNCPDLNLMKRGKVRDIYDLDEMLLIVATDRISAYDCVLPDPIPGKGKILTELSLFWFEFLEDITENHLVTAELAHMPKAVQQYSDQLEGRSMLVKKAEPIPVECVVRGYITGSAWDAYVESGEICGIELPDGLEKGQKLEDPIFTPATKAEEGHDQNIPFDRVKEITSREVAHDLRTKSVEVYRRAARYAEQRDVYIIDTKFEWGWIEGNLTLIDEVLTPDSSRFCAGPDYTPGEDQTSFDKQYVRDYLDSLDWDKEPPAPSLPDDVIEKTCERYRKAVDMLKSNPV